MIAAALLQARAHPKVRALVPERVLAVFDDAAIDQFSLALGNVLVKYELSAPSWLARYKDEAVLVWVCFCLYVSVQAALAPAAAPQGQREEKVINPGPGDPKPHVDGEASPA